MTREELLKLKTLNDDLFVETLLAIFSKYDSKILELEKNIAKLEAQILKNSTNSSKPPSTDGFKKKAKDRSLRPETDKLSGGQPNHKGHTLEKVASPDHIVILEDKVCPFCSTSFKNVPSIEVITRQVFDTPPVKMESTEYQIHSKYCPHCKKKSRAQVPNNINQPVSYGTNVQTHIAYLNIQNHIPYKRIKEFFYDFYKWNISEGSILNILNRAYVNLESTEQSIKEAIINSSVVNFDETGGYIMDKRQWLFTHSTKQYTFYEFHSKRGKIAMDEIGILPKFKGIAVHDGWKAYAQYTNCAHALCNAHHLRELKGILETTKFKFPSILTKLLLEAKTLVESGVEITKDLKNSILSKYQKSLDEAFEEELLANPVIREKTGKQGRHKQSPAKNLLLRLSKIPEVMGFLIKPNLIPFTNNLAEQDVRMTKVKQKVSGLFRSLQGAKNFCRIRGYISTIAKNGINILEALESVFLGTPILP